MTDRSCTGCGKPIRARNKSGMCNPCSSHSPEARAKRAATYRQRIAENPEMLDRMRERARANSANPNIVAKRNEAVRTLYASDPSLRERQSRVNKARIAKRMKDDPAFAAQLRASGRRLGKHGNSHSPERSAKVRAIKMAWCPPAYWDLNNRLRVQKLTLEERKAIIADQVRHDEIVAARRAVADIDRQMREKHARRLAQAY